MVYVNFSSNLPTGLQNFEFVDLTNTERLALPSIFRRIYQLQTKVIYSAMKYHFFTTSLKQMVIIPI